MRSTFNFTVMGNLAGLIFALASLAVSSTLATSSRPHVILILADDYGFHDIGYHGSKIKTPVLDKLAGEGVKLEKYYVQPICTPTRSQLMTGRYQIHTGLQHGVIRPWTPNALPLDEVTLPQKLKEYGYATHMVGKWHLGFYKEEFVPIKRGFDTFFGYYTGSEDYLTHIREDGLDFRDNDKVATNYNNTYSSIVFAEHAKKVVLGHNKSQPLFLYIPFQAVHAPLEAPASYIEPYKTVFPDDESRQIYAGMVACMDEAIGNITSTLQSTGLYDNSVIIFSTDNGGQVKAGGNNWPLRGWKDTLWEGGVRAVGFVHSPLLPKQVLGTVNHQLIHVSDWFPTIVEGLAKGDTKGTKPLDGYNVWPCISENKASPRKEILHNIDPVTVIKDGKKWKNSTFDVRVRAALRSGDWKILTGVKGSVNWIAPPSSGIVPFYPNVVKDQVVFLFNITADPNEYNDLSGKYPEVVDSMLEKLANYNKTAVPCVHPLPDPKSDPKFHGGVWGPWQ
ncbi:arylsulfatase J-like isoform X1 [Anneissia japonica]|uniref:arylsulfatase J-like isoform X1 n=1 Tax=Anneissia japonica TaxID=1529436 RepID=UPI00142577CA|nr:arylsulfatase J-like isoform X1 [Anneissia japonica]XP_033112649.1 arylsulfatase J-like isoform X1 [Anneissia japonica]XP_033112651.1 arylsulfatase J-like isoform X1 [Anneissia japonica]